MNNTSHFYIMSAGCLVDNKTVNIQDAHKTWEGTSGTILVAKRQRSWDKYSKIFIHGAPGNYGVQSDTKTMYTQDTGMGYKCRNHRLIVENVIHIDEEGNITSENDIGLNEKRRLWVMK